MSERSIVGPLGVLLIVVCSFLAPDSWARGRHSSTLNRKSIPFSRLDKVYPAQRYDLSKSKLLAQPNPYAAMSCLQLYVLAVKSQNEAEEKEFSKKDCGSL